MARISSLVVAVSLTAAARVYAAPGDGASTAPGAADDPYVVGGTVAPEGKWPDTAAVYFGSQPGCTGVLVAPDLVLTAGHCIGGVTQVKLGVNDVRGAGDTIPVAQQMEYPNWFDTYDVGLLILERPSVVEPRALAVDCIDEYIVDGAEVAIVGYGAIDENGRDVRSELREAYTTITDADCDNLTKGCAADVSPGGELGAGGNGIDSCSGDSGGPLYLLTERGEFLVGLTSRGYADATLTCSQGGIYVRPDAVVEWIEQMSGRSVARPTCNLAPAPVVEPIEVRAGTTRVVSVAPNDPDAGDSHYFEVATEPAHGIAEIDGDGNVLYTADADYEGADEFAVRVIDSGAPALSADATVLVTVLPADGGCGCRTGASGSGGWLAALVLLAGVLRRRRRPGPRRPART